ncbi:hypothetical protein D3C75_782770 [compost metagenome]
MGVETVPGAILDLDAVEGDVGVVARFAWNVAVEPTVDLARGVVTVAVDGEVADTEVVGLLAIGGADDSGDLGVGAVSHLDGGCAHAVAVQVDVALEHQAAVGGFLTSRNDISSGRHVHLPPACSGRRINCILYCRRIVSDAISFGAKILYIENHEFISVSGENLGRCQYSIGSYRVMTQRSAKVVTAYRGSVKKPN